MRPVGAILILTISFFILTGLAAAQGLPAPIDRNVAVSATVQSSTPPPPAPQGGGGGGGSIATTPQLANVELSGLTAPNSTANAIDNEGRSITVEVGLSGAFVFRFSDVVAGAHSYSIWSRDAQGFRSITMSFALNAVGGVTTSLSNIFLSPTLAVEEPVVAIDGQLKVSGSSAPNSKIRLTFFSETVLAETTSNNHGYFEHTLLAKIFGAGDHIVRAQAQKPDGLQSAISQSVSFRVGTRTSNGQNPKRADVNQDGKIDLVDLSIILAYWGGAPAKRGADINSDGVVNLTDISILLYEWTG